MRLGKVDLEFCGGGFWGASQPAWVNEEFLTAIWENEGEVTRIGGVSVGAIVGAKLSEAQKQDELIRKSDELARVFGIIDRIGPKSVFPLHWWTIFLSLFKESLLNGSTLADLVYGRTFNGPPLDAESIMNSPIEFGTLVFNIESGEQEIISNHDELTRKFPPAIIDAVIASASLPPFFPSMAIRNTNSYPRRVYRDNGHIDLRPAIKAGCDAIFVFLPYKENRDTTKHDGILSWLFPWLMEVMEIPSEMNMERDRVEIARAVETSEFIEVIEVVNELHGVVRSSFWLPSKRRRIEEGFQKAEAILQSKRTIRVFPIYINQHSNSFEPYSFERGDISRLDAECREQMRIKLKEWGLKR